MEKTCEVILWSIAFPGFGQIRNGKLLKGIVFVGLEFLINVQSNLNDVIVSSFHGDIDKATNTTNFQWLMFYPCVYMFAMWDAYKDACEGPISFSVYPFAFAAFFGTIGVIFSKDFLGPVWLGIIGAFVGIAIGSLIKKLLHSSR